jgi:ligand-binding sensor domain-containing protein
MKIIAPLRWCLVIIFLPFQLLAQAEVEPEFRHLTIENGLSHNTVYDILQDHEGFMWMGTRYGLNRYDGYDFKVYLSGKEPNKLAGPTVLCLMEDQEGNIWVGHKDAGISILERKTGQIKRFAIQGFSWQNLSVRKIYQDRDGLIWICTIGKGLICVNSAGEILDHLYSKHKEPNKQLGTDFIFDVVEDPSGKLWIAGSGKSIYSYNKRTNSISSISSSDNMLMVSFEKSLCLDKKGNLWIGTSGSGLYQYQLQSGEITHYCVGSDINHALSNNRVTSVKTDSLDRLWVATDGGGIQYFDQAKKEFIPLLASGRKLRSLNTNAIYTLCFDRSGSLWAGTFNGGVNVHSRNVSPFVSSSFLLPGAVKSVLTIEEDSSGTIWLGTDGEGLSYFHPLKPELGVQVANIGANKVITCLKSNKGRGLWIGTFANGLGYFQPSNQTVKVFRFEPGSTNTLPHNNVWDIDITPEGNLWIATLGGGLSYFDLTTQQFTNFDPEQKDTGNGLISSFQIIDVLHDARRRLVWCASEDKGLSCFNTLTRKFSHYREDSKDKKHQLSSDKLRCLFLDKQGRVWIGTEFSGLNILDEKGNVSKQLNTENGLSSNVIHAISEDALGFIWITTQKGIQRIDPKTWSLVDIGSDDNLRNNQYNPKASLLLKSGGILFGGTGGFTTLSPILDKLISRKEQVIFSELKLFNQSVGIGLVNEREILPVGLNEEGCIVQLSYSDKAIVFEFSSNEIGNLAKKRFAYMLEGFDKNWNMLNTGEHRAAFSALPYGKYKLRVKVLNFNNEWSDERVLMIYVKPPFWKTWWFISLSIILLLMAIFLTFYYSLKRQQARYRNQAQLAQQEILRLKNENLENEIQAKQAEQEILRLNNESLEREILVEKRGQEILKLSNENLEREVFAKRTEKEILRLRNENLEREISTKQAEQELLNLKNEHLAREVEAKQTRLSASLLQSAHKNQFLNDLLTLLQKIDPAASNSKTELRKVIREINQEIKQEDYWEQFQFHFDEMHKNFVTKLKTLHPQISSNDQRLCCLLRLDLNNREIASILHITVNGVEQTKYRLKKKMDIGEKVTLNEYIRSI